MAEVVYGEPLLVTRLGKTDIQFYARNAEGHLPRARVAETASAQRDIGLICFLLDEAMIKRLTILVVKIDGYSTAALLHCYRAIDAYQRRTIGMAHGGEVIQ